MGAKCGKTVKNDLDILNGYIVWKCEKGGSDTLKSSKNGAHLVLRVNDCPEDLLFTLLINGKEFAQFSQWPREWITISQT